MKNLFAGMLVIAVSIAAWAGEPALPQDAVSGVVTAIQHVQPPNGVGRVRVTIFLDDGADGGGSIVSFDEWDTLWARGDRYRVGQKLVLQVYPASKLGLTSESRQSERHGQQSGTAREDCLLKEAQPCRARPGPQESPPSWRVRRCDANNSRSCAPRRGDQR